MSSKKYLIAIDQGTTSARTILYDTLGREIKSSSCEVQINCPEDGYVEQCANDIWSAQIKTINEVVSDIDLNEVDSIGITNQRETVICWDKETGEPLAPAIVWQCRRSSEICTELRKAGHEDFIKEQTGLVLDPYFSASKIKWLVENNDKVSAKVKLGKAIFGTVDSWIVYKLSGEVLTEPSNASRTMLYSIVDGKWSEKLLKIFGLDESMLPEVKPSFGNFSNAKIQGVEIPITGVLGDQQSSLLGHACLEKGDIKCTFGTGAFLLSNTADSIQRPSTGLLSTIAWTNNSTTFAIEGSVFMAGALISWLKKDLNLINEYSELDGLLSQTKSSDGVVVVPAFTGLGAPYWNDHARGAVFGLTRASTKAHFARACLEGVANCVADVLEDPCFKDSSSISIDGGMSKNPHFNQILADLTGREVISSTISERTARGAALAAAVGSSFYNSLESAVSEFKKVEEKEESVSKFSPNISKQEKETLRSLWKKAVERSLDWAPS